MGIRDIATAGQSVWFDYIQRSMIWTGELHRMVAEDGLAGVTSNPSIFENAISSGTEYAPAVRAAVLDGATAAETAELLSIEDVKLACDVLRPVYDSTEGKDGYVSLEVSPYLANDAQETRDEGLELWSAVARENLMIKVPATKEGLIAIEALISEGVNVNATLLFSVERYQEVWSSFVRGLERYAAGGGDPAGVASVASFFISRIDTAVDAQIDEKLAAGDLSDADKGALEALRGKAAIANAKAAYKAYEAALDTELWKQLAKQGARPQRLLWASTSTKNPAYRDVRYVEELIGPDTVNTIPAATYQAFQAHGVAEPRLRAGVDTALADLKRLGELGIDLDEITDTLEAAGVKAFSDAYDRLVGVVERARRDNLGSEQPSMRLALDDATMARLEARLDQMDKIGFNRRLWERDGSLFSEDPEAAKHASGFMGWLDIVDFMQEKIDLLIGLQDQLHDAEVESVVLMGMGGSSLAPDVFSRTFGQLDASPELLVLDSTVPAQVKTIEREVELDASMFIVASKSGTTAEPLSFYAHFFDLISQGAQFLAVTDPGSKLEHMAIDQGFSAIYNGDPEVGGRFSALSPFGLVPAAAMGLDVGDLIDRAMIMIGSCEQAVPAKESPGAQLGAALGELALAGRDKLTFIISPTLSSLGAWIEQLVAESTGKHGKGIVPVDGEQLGGPEVYGSDRVFVSVTLDEDDADWQNEVEGKLAKLAEAGHPIIRMHLAEREDLVQEMFRWEIATAVAGYVLQINPFDQPNVQESKSFTNELLQTYEETGALPPVPGQELILEAEGLKIYADADNIEALKAEQGDLQALLRAHLARAGAGDYVALNAFVEMNEAHEAVLQQIRSFVRDDMKLATTVGFGPRFLHSTGQLHKGGANNGLFFQITCDDAEDMPVPGKPFTFGTLKTAQEAGDFMALSARKRRVLRVHLGADVEAGLKKLAELLGA